MTKNFPILLLSLLLLAACDREKGKQMTVTLDDTKGWQTMADFEENNVLSDAAVYVQSDTFRLHFYGWGQDEDSLFHVSLPENTDKFGRCILQYTMCGWNKGPAEWDMTTMIRVKDKQTGEWYELSRCITPYGGSFSANWLKVYYLDVTPLMSLLSGDTEFKIFYCGWDASATRAHACTLGFYYFNGKNPNGHPAWHQKIYDSTLNGNTGYRSWAYGVEGHSIEDSARLGQRTIHVPAGTKNIVLRSCFTGHGQDALTVGNGKFPGRPGYKPVNVAEFDYNEYRIILNGDTLSQTGYLFEENGDNYKQAGTYKYDRCGWGPGKPCNVHYWTIRNIPSDMGVITIDMDMDEYIGKNTAPNAESVAQFYVMVDAYGYN